MPGQSGPRSNGNEGVLQHYWSLSIRLFSVISRTLVGGSLAPLQKCSLHILYPQPTGLEHSVGKSRPIHSSIETIISQAIHIFTNITVNRVNFQTNTLQKVMNLLIFPAMG